MIAILLDAVAIIASVLVTALMLFLVLARYVLQISVVGLHELVLLFAMQLYMAGALIASRRREHLTVDWLAQNLTGRGKALHEALIAAVTIVITCFFVVWAWRMLSWGMQMPQTTAALGMPLWVPQLAIMVAAPGSVAYAVRDLVRAVRALRG